MPSPTIGILGRVRGLGKGSVHETSLADRRVLVHDRTDDGMTEAHLRSNLEQARIRRRVGRVRRDTQVRGGCENQGRITNRLGGRHQQQAPAVFGERSQPPPEALFDLGRHGYAIRQAEATRECGRCPTSRQLEDGERVAAGLGDDPIPDRFVEPSWHRRRQQGVSVRVAKRRDRQLGHAG